jgi:hypothetical protein
MRDTHVHDQYLGVGASETAAAGQETLSANSNESSAISTDSRQP